MLTRIHSVAREYNDRVGTLKTSSSDEEALLHRLSSFGTIVDQHDIILYSLYENFESFHNGVPLLVC